MSKKASRQTILWASVGIVVLADPAVAQVVKIDPGIGEIIVTAQRREERLQDVPIAVTAVTSGALASKQIQNTLDLAQVVPALTFTSTAGSTQVRIRGVGTTNFGPAVENPVAVYIDGVYIESTSAAFFNLANIERVEVLKGPQGTLFGRNATGGLVQIVTPDPSDVLQGLARASYGNYETVMTDVYLSGPIVKDVSADLAVHYGTEGEGWGRNIETGRYVNQIKDDLVVRSKIKVEPTSNLKFVLSADYSYLLGSRPVTLAERSGYAGDYEQIFGVAPRGGFYDINSAVSPRARITNGGTSLTSTLNLGAAQIKSITAYRRTKFEDRFSLARAPEDILDFNGTPKWHQFSQEVQITGKASRLTYTAGLFYFRSTDQYDPFSLEFGPALASTLVAPGVVTANLIYNSRQKTESSAGYAQATYEVFPQTHLTLGGRYTSETKRAGGTQSFVADFGAPVGLVTFVPDGTPYLSPGISPKVHYTNFSYRAALDHKITSNILAYVSYNTGFKGGGYNLTTPTNPAYLPEKLRSIEGGLKIEMFDRRLRVNLSGYHYNYNNIQVSNFIKTAPFIVNAARAKIDGFEIEADAKPTRDLALNLGMAYTDDRFTSFPNAGYSYVVAGCQPTGSVDTPCLANAAGNKLPATPTFTVDAGFSYQRTIGSSTAGLTGNVFHSSGWFGTYDNDPREFQKSYNVVNGSIYLEPGTRGLRFSIWGKNLFGEKYAQNRYISAQEPTFQAGAPRTYGVTVEKKF